MGTVYRAEQLGMPRPVALKMLSLRLCSNDQARERWRRETQAYGRLPPHPHLVFGIAAGEWHRLPYLAMEYLEGCDLKAWLDERGPLPVAEACEYVRQAALGLQFAFEHGLVHRDVKPGNLWRTPDGRVKVLDLGLALLPEATVDTPLTVGLHGTPDYMAPEQIDNSHDVDVRADVYSLGATLYALLAGRPPFAHVSGRDRLFAKLDAVRNQPPPPVAERRPDVPAGLAALLGRLLAKKPEDRPPTPGAVAAALAPWAQADSAPTAPAGKDGPGGQDAGSPDDGQSMHPSRGPLPAGSRYYVPRPADERFWAALTNPYTGLIRVRGPKQMGKTSLLAHGRCHAERHGLTVVAMDLQSCHDAELASARALSCALADRLAAALGITPTLSDCRDEKAVPNQNLRSYLADRVLPQLSRPLVWMLDEVDRLFGAGPASDLFRAFRSWFNERSSSARSPFRRLTWVFSYATDARLFLAHYTESVFHNVGEEIDLDDFTLEQVGRLNDLYGRPLDDAAGLRTFHELVAGHPALTHQGLRWLAQNHGGLAALQEQALGHQGPFGDHLRHLAGMLWHTPELYATLRALARPPSPPSLWRRWFGGPRPAPAAALSLEEFERLRSAGLIVGHAPGQARIRCPLYALYLEQYGR
jgi:hypothetical protein